MHIAHTSCWPSVKRSKCKTEQHVMNKPTVQTVRNKHAEAQYQPFNISLSLSNISVRWSQSVQTVDSRQSRVKVNFPKA